MFNLSQNPIVKLIGVIAIIYFVFFNKKNDQVQKITSEDLANKITNTQEHFSRISNNIKILKEYDKALKGEIVFSKGINSIYSDYAETASANQKNLITIKCGTTAKVREYIYTTEGRLITNQEDYKYQIGSNESSIIENQLIDAKEGSVKIISIPSKEINLDKRLNELFTNKKINIDDVKAYILIEKIFTESEDKSIKCNK